MTASRFQHAASTPLTILPTWQCLCVHIIELNKACATLYQLWQSPPVTSSWTAFMCKRELSNACCRFDKLTTWDVTFQNSEGPTILQAILKGYVIIAVHKASATLKSIVESTNLVQPWITSLSLKSLSEATLAFILPWCLLGWKLGHHAVWRTPCCMNPAKLPPLHYSAMVPKGLTDAGIWGGGWLRFLRR